MKKIFALLPLLALSLQAQTNALVQFYQTNALGFPDTNYFILYKLQPPVLANGSVKTAGFGIRCTPNTNGFFQTNLQLGFYLWTNAFIGAPGIVFTVPQSTNVYNAGIPYGQPGGLAISGYNTYVMAGVLGMSSSNATVTVTPIANSPGFFDLAAIGGTSTNGGTVTSVGLAAPGIFTVSGSPVTVAGTLTLALATEVANTVFAGPSSGGAVAPTFRALVASDIPVLSYVTSVGLAAPAEFTVSGSPVTGSGTLTFSKANQNANLIYAGPSSGGAAAPAFRSLVAGDFANQSANLFLGGPTTGAAAAPTFRTITLASADFANQGTTTTVLHGNAAGNPSFGSVALGDMANLAANSVIGNNTGSPATPIALTPSQVLDIIGSTRGSLLERGASGWTLISPGTSGLFLQSQGPGADPIYAAAGGGSQTPWLSDINGNGFSLTNANQISASGFTNLSATASTVAAYDANKKLISIANGGANTFLQGTTPPTYTGITAASLPVLQTAYPQALTNNDNRTGGAVFNESVTFTNNASGAQVNPTGTNVQFMTWNTNSAGAMKTNTITMGGLGTANVNVQALNTNSVQTLLVTQDGALTVGTNSQFTVDTTGNIAFKGSAFGDGGSLSNLNAGSLTGGVWRVDVPGFALIPGDANSMNYVTNTPSSGFGAIQGAGPSRQMWQILNDHTNLYAEFPLPYNYDGGTITAELWFTGGTNWVTQTTNDVSASASTYGTALGTAIRVTNRVDLIGVQTFWATNSQMPGITIAGTPKAGRAITVQFQVWNKSPYFTITNQVYAHHASIWGTCTATQRGSITMP